MVTISSVSPADNPMNLVALNANIEAVVKGLEPQGVVSRIIGRKVAKIIPVEKLQIVYKWIEANQNLFQAQSQNQAEIVRFVKLVKRLEKVVGEDADLSKQAEALALQLTVPKYVKSLDKIDKALANKVFTHLATKDRPHPLESFGLSRARQAELAAQRGMEHIRMNSLTTVADTINKILDSNKPNKLRHAMSLLKAQNENKMINDALNDLKVPDKVRVHFAKMVAKLDRQLVLNGNSTWRAPLAKLTKLIKFRDITHLNFALLEISRAADPKTSNDFDMIAGLVQANRDILVGKQPSIKKAYFAGVIRGVLKAFKPSPAHPNFSQFSDLMLEFRDTLLAKPESWPVRMKTIRELDKISEKFTNKVLARAVEKKIIGVGTDLDKLTLGIHPLQKRMHDVLPYIEDKRSRPKW